jgi:hypothetical protein
MVNGNNNNRGRRNNQRGGRRQQQQRQSNAPPFSVIPHTREVRAVTSGNEITIAMPAKPAVLGVRTHIKYHVMSHQPFNIQPRPPPANSRTLSALESGWIKVQDWDDVKIIGLVDSDVHITFSSRGFVQL